MPPGDDPDSLLRNDPAAWPGLVAGAQPLVDYVLEAVVASLDLTQPRAKSQAVERVAPLLYEIGEAIQQAHYVGLLSRRLGIADQDIRAKVREVRHGGRQAARQIVRAETAAARAVVAPEDYLLGLLLRYPDVATGLIDTIAPDDFTDARNRLIWEALRARLHAEGAAAPDQLRTSLDETLGERCTALLAQQHAGKELYVERARAEIIQALRTIRERRERQERDYWQSALREAQAGDESVDLATVQQRLAVLASGDRQRAYYPPPSPYFRDIRDKA
jgi:DNA primase